MDFYGTVAAGDADAVEGVCARVVEDLGLKRDACDLVVAWGRRFFETVDACRRTGFRSLHACECASLVDTCTRLGARIDPDPYVDELFRYMRSPPLHPEAQQALAALPVPICCVSNADTLPLREAIACHDLPFAEVVCSEDVRSYKPQAEIFQSAMRRMAVNAEHVLHVGDSLHSDVAGGRGVGIDTAWVCRNRRIHDVGTADATYKINSLKELCQIMR